MTRLFHTLALICFYLAAAFAVPGVAFALWLTEPPVS